MSFNNPNYYKYQTDLNLEQSCFLAVHSSIELGTTGLVRASIRAAGFYCLPCDGRSVYELVIKGIGRKFAGNVNALEEMVELLGINNSAFT